MSGQGLFFFLQDGSLHLSELCKPAVLVLVGSALGSSVLGICLIHLSKSLRWISIRCQVPVIITTVEEREADKAGFPLHRRIETIFPLKCIRTILTKQKKNKSPLLFPAYVRKLSCFASLQNDIVVIVTSR